MITEILGLILGIILMCWPLVLAGLFMMILCGVAFIDGVLYTVFAMGHSLGELLRDAFKGGFK